MIACSDFAPGDLAELVPQVEQAGTIDTGPAHAAQLMAAGPCFSIRDDRRLILIGGFIEQGDGKAHAWARLAADQARTMVALTRMVRRIFDASEYRRIEMVVRTAFQPGHAWADARGFAREGTLAAWGPNGEDFDMYSRVRAGQMIARDRARAVRRG